MKHLTGLIIAAIAFSGIAWAAMAQDPQAGQTQETSQSLATPAAEGGSCCKKMSGGSGSGAGAGSGSGSGSGAGAGSGSAAGAGSGSGTSAGGCCCCSKKGAKAEKTAGAGSGSLTMVPSGDQSVASKAFTAANENMHAAMAQTMTGNPDVDFVSGMIPHHKGALDMAKIAMAFGKDPEIRKLAEDIVKAQEAEIALMEAWLKKQPKQ